MEISLIIITTFLMLLANIIFYIYRLTYRIEVLQDSVISLIEEATCVDETIDGLRNVVIAALQSEVDELKREVANLKKNNQKCLKHGDSPCGNGHTA
jgi:hypothetical protein